MIEEFDEDYDCWEWFQAGKENILRSFDRKKAANGQQQTQLTRKFNNRNNRIKTAAPAKFPNEALEEILNLQPLGMFLYLTTTSEPDFFVDQIGPNDDMERVIIYTRILITLCDLELPGFHHDLLKKVASCTPLLKHYEEIVRKLCTKSYRTMWTDLERVDKIIWYMQTLLLQAQRADVMDATAMQILFNIWTHLKSNFNPLIAQRPVCKQFLYGLDIVFSVDLEILNIPRPVAELYPSLEELRQWISRKANSNPEAPKPETSYNNTTQYINNQLLLLRHQFLMPLRELVCKLHLERNLGDFKTLHFVFENVQIKLNQNFNDALYSKLLYIDILAGKRKAAAAGEAETLAKADEHALSKLKNGTLLCLSTSFDFDNLILATVSAIDISAQSRGYIAITILRQYNIGNIYKKMLIVFETPVYFEPFQKAYRYLLNSNVLNFPMADFIVHGVNRTHPPLYLNHTQPPNVYESQKFKNKLAKMPLNISQREAFEHVLTTNFNLIQGPPGTGKTHVSLQLVKTILENAKHCAPIVVITYTNDSLDKFLLKLSAHTSSIVRFGCQLRIPEIVKFNARSDRNMHMINPKLKRLYWMVNMELKEHFQRLQSLYAAFNETKDEGYAEILATQRLIWNTQEKLNCIRIIFQHYLIAKKNVLAMTTTCAARMNFVFRFLKTRIVIFEESAEILEAHLLPCLTPFTEQIIMIGDHMQLKPYCSYIRGIQNSEYSQSLFERLIRANFHVNVLNIQYRMRNDFVDLICPLIYKKLLSHQSVTKFPPIRKMTKNLYFLDHRQFETMQNNTLPTNAWEKHNVYLISRHLIEVGGYNSDEIVVLTPYSSQVASIKSEFSKHASLKAIGVSTVDSFQGLEANIVILSLVRSNAHRKIGFLVEPTRICVALSRARYGLYIIGNMESLAHNSLTWCEIRKSLRLQNAIGCEFPYIIDI
ncbi:NFX1-type zinc finger-containing protein 1-like [Drosophila sulfurigaster albostrigata]|uniref:NFX1-type zinc finger-containing protein 1-like n=1 Tax=Drosophila sulfurigaster albostrigata TaxID=89887 RepID=UPI002D21BB7B|nr:NFX1-type zinc finger-containing protein 1-like [Drosophila sulfurigaster albostrigata]